jgi:hypothetical protein
MENVNDLVGALKTGGDASWIIAGFILWRMHERLIRLETKLLLLTKGKDDDAP